MNKKMALVLISIMLVIGLFLSGTMFSLWGFATLGLTKADFKVKDTLPDGTFWNQELWILHVSQSQLGHRASGVITPEEIGAESGEVSEKSFYIEMAIDQQNCEYPLHDEQYAPQIGKYHLEYWDVLFEGPCTDVEINRRCPDAIFSGMFAEGANLLKPKCYCVDEAQQVMAVDVHIENPYTRTVSSILVGNDGTGWDEMLVDTQQADRIRGFITPNVYLSWEGYHSTDFQCPSQDELFAYESIDGFPGPQTSWKVGYRNNYDSYQQKLTDLEADIIALGPDCGLIDCRNEAERLVGLINDAADDAMEQRFVDEHGNTIEVRDAVIVRDILNANQDPKLIKIPQYVFYIKADYLGIEVLRPDIKITSAQMQGECFQDHGTVSVGLRNDGENGAAMLSIRDCPAGISGGTANVGVDAGQTTTASVTLDSSVSQRTTGTCEVVSNDGYHTSTRTFTVCALPNTADCSPGEIKCVDDKIQECNAQATGWVVVEDCTASEKCAEGQDGKCSQSSGTPTCYCDGSPPPPSGCPSFWEDPIGWFLCTLGTILGDAFSGLLILGLIVMVIIIIGVIILAIAFIYIMRRT